jgi:hypothetical protein
LCAELTAAAQSRLFSPHGRRAHWWWVGSLGYCNRVEKNPPREMRRSSPLLLLTMPQCARGQQVGASKRADDTFSHKRTHVPPLPPLVNFQAHCPSRYSYEHMIV